MPPLQALCCAKMPSWFTGQQLRGQSHPLPRSRALAQQMGEIKGWKHGIKTVRVKAMCWAWRPHFWSPWKGQPRHFVLGNHWIKHRQLSGASLLDSCGFSQTGVIACPFASWCMNAMEKSWEWSPRQVMPLSHLAVVLWYEIIDKICMYQNERSHAYISTHLHIHKV